MMSTDISNIQTTPKISSFQSLVIFVQSSALYIFNGKSFAANFIFQNFTKNFESYWKHNSSGFQVEELSVNMQHFLRRKPLKVVVFIANGIKYCKGVHNIILSN